jgi:hypothetical protein
MDRREGQGKARGLCLTFCSAVSLSLSTANRPERPKLSLSRSLALSLSRSLALSLSRSLALSLSRSLSLSVVCALSRALARSLSVGCAPETRLSQAASPRCRSRRQTCRMRLFTIYYVFKSSLPHFPLFFFSFSLSLLVAAWAAKSLPMPLPVVLVLCPRTCSFPCVCLLCQIRSRREPSAYMQEAGGKGATL